MNSLANKHNVRYCSEENPRVTIEIVMQSLNMSVSCSTSESRAIGPYFFDDDIINVQNYHSISKECFVPELKRLGKVSCAIFQEDKAPPHFSRDVRQYFDKIFPNRWIGKGGSIRWAPRSPDLSR